MSTPAETSAREDFAREAALIGVLVLMQVMVTSGIAYEAPETEPRDALAYVLLVIGPLGLFLRRVDAALPVLVSLLSLGVYLVLGYPFGPVVLSFAFSLIIAQLDGRRLVAWTATALFVGFLVAALTWRFGQPMEQDKVVGISSIMVVVTVVSEQVRVRRESARQRERAQAEEALRVAGDGRLQLARDLHDVLAHSLSVINVQAGVALHLLGDREQVESSLNVIRTTSRDTLSEIRGTLNSLRGETEAPTAPTASLKDLGRLVRAARDAGVTTTTEVELGGRELPARVDIAAYRIVQEALTNVTKHSTARRAKVGIRLDENVLVVRVSDEGRARTLDQDRSGAGHGIHGMRERATELGGSLNAGQRRYGGFVVEARLPLGDGS
ncbi:sensor histidine kinase [Amycolatopsis nigrescens]|uniref:sensor histidine kinase n=1 Tax=Amycolatopsis nigrescens TaxID=381445 RepID=UPI00038239C9|nr:histidine kinase [Amycolatopsis nigrescens]